MINTKVLDWIEGYILSRVLFFGDFLGTVNRTDFLLDLDTTSEHFRKFEGQRIQALSLPVKNRNLTMLLGEIEVCFQRGWELLDAGEWTSEEYDRVYQLSREICTEIASIRGDLEKDFSG